ncbi:hypothetical protein SteCoe_26863 [Stentor coeruleus]|uniref:Uncharacterized protein n=1 Tax=Stentor coeruleus TaxID=5963 RepID=A0A1R2BBX6_9CILI|nr:hypothetical protein SteCoe_26863 [Stentor coeruleus]
MKIPLENYLELLFYRRYSVKIYCINNSIQAYTKDFQTLKEWSSLITGLSISMFAWLIKRPSWASSKFSLNLKTLEVIYQKGLKGGSTHSSSNQISLFSIQLYPDHKILVDLKENQIKANELSTKVSQSIEELRIEMNEFSSLEKISPNEDSYLYIDAINILENFDVTECLIQTKKLEEKASVALVARKFFNAYFMKNQKVVSIAEFEKKKLLSRIDYIIGAIERNGKLNQKLYTKVEAEIINNIIDNAKEIQIWWQIVINELKDILSALVGLKSIDPIPALTKLLSYFSIARERMECKHEYLFHFDIFEKDSTIASDIQDQIQYLIAKGIEEMEKIGLGEVNLILDLFENCIYKEKISELFLLNVQKAYFHNNIENKTWEIKLKLANILRSLRGHWHDKISQEADHLHEIMGKYQQDNKLRIVLDLSLGKLTKAKVSNELVKKQDEFITNKIHTTDLIVGRDEVIREIYTKLQANNILVVAGLGGIGKTSVALKYAEDFKRKYQIIWVVNGENMTKDLNLFAIILGIPKDSDTLENLKVILRSEKIRQSILLIFDNLEGKAQLKDYYVKSDNIHFLITSRSSDWEECIEIGYLTEIQSIDYLTKKLIERNESDDYLRILAQRWGGYALGLKQSIINIKINKFSIKDYLEINQEILIDEEILVTLESIFGKFTEETFNALELISYFQLEDIPEEIIKKIIIEKYGIQEWGKIRSQLMKFYIINVRSEGKWNVHRIIMEFIRSKNKGKMKELLVKYYYENFTCERGIYNDKIRVEEIKAMIPHVQEFLKKIKLDCKEEIFICCELAKANLEINSDFKETEKTLEKITEKEIEISQYENKESIAKIWRYVAGVFLSMTKVDKSEEYYMKCLDISEQVLSPLHPDLAALYMGIGCLYEHKENYIKSEEFYMKCLKIREEILTPLHPSLAMTYISIGNFYKHLNDLTKLEEILMKGLKIMEQISAPLQLDLAELYMGLGELYLLTNDYIKSEEFFIKCLKIKEEIFPPIHLKLASTYFSFGVMSFSAGNDIKSEELYMKSLKICEQILPPFHPNLILIYMVLGLSYRIDPECKKSEEYYMKFLKINEEISPPLNQNLSTIYMLMGDIYKDNSDYKKSEEYYMKSLKIKEQILPQPNSKLSLIYMNLGNLHRINLDYMKSEEYYMKCLKIKEQILPPVHPDLAELYMILGELHFNKNDCSRSIEFYMKCLKINEQILPPLDLKLAEIYIVLGVLHFVIFIKSEKFFLKSLNIMELILPPLDFQLVYVYKTLGSLYMSKYNYEKSEEFYIKSLKIKEQIPLDDEIAEIYLDMGDLYNSKGETVKSENFIIKSFEIREKIFPPLDPGLAALYMSNGLCYKYKYNYKISKKLLIKCLKIKEQILLPNDPELAELYKNIGDFYEYFYNYTKSLEYYIKYLNISEQILPPLHENLATIYDKMGNLYLKTKDYTKSKEFSIKCHKIREQI